MLESMINTIVRLGAPPLMRDKNYHCEPFDVDWIIKSNLQEESKEFWLQTVSGAQGLRLLLKDAQFISFQPGKSADLKSASKGLLFLNCSWIIFPEGKPAECVTMVTFC